MKAVGVFGANGFMGRHLVRRLAHSGVRTVAFGRDFPEDFFRAVGCEVETRKVDLNDELQTYMMLQDLTDVVQLINSSNPAMANNRVISDLMQNVVPQVRFIESCIAAQIKSFVFISSGGTVYGTPRSTPIAEDHPTAPLNSYGLTKLTVEHYLKMLSRTSNMRHIILRVSNPFGAGQLSHKGQGLIATVLKRFSDNEKVTVFGDGSAERDYIYVDDVIDAIELSLASEVVGVLNIGSGHGRSILEVLSAIEAELGCPIGRSYVDGRATDAPSNVLDISKATALLKWTPQTSFPDAISRTVSAFRRG